MSYTKNITTLAARIIELAKILHELEKDRAEWEVPERRSFRLGRDSVYVVRKDGSIYPGLEEVYAAIVKALDDAIIRAKSRLEGARFQLTQLGKETR